MEYEKILISVEYDDDILHLEEFLEWSLKGFTNQYFKIDDRHYIIDTVYSKEDLLSELDDYGVLVDLYEINYDNFRMVLTEYDEPFVNNVLVKMKELDISDDINYFLDLVSKKGGTHKLTSKERQILYKLSN